MTTNGGGTWLKKLISAVAILLVVAVVSRIVFELLKPLIPGLVILLILAVVFAVAFGAFRR